MNAGRLKTSVAAFMVLALARAALPQAARNSVNEGNKLYTQGRFNKAINKYDEALIDRPEASEPKFNKANSYYRLDDLTEAIELYRAVAAETKNMKLVTRARYNTGNCFFHQGIRQKDSDLQKAMENLETSIRCWRQVLDIEPENEKAARNIEVARLIIKDILDQLNKQQDPNQPQDPNQGQNRQQKQQQQQQGSQQDPNQPQDPNQSQQQKQAEDPNQSRDQQEPQQKQQQQVPAPDATAQEILDKEQRQKKERQILQRAGYQKVEKDW